MFNVPLQYNEQNIMRVKIVLKHKVIKILKEMLIKLHKKCDLPIFNLFR